MTRPALSPGESKLSHIAEVIGDDKFAHLENGEDNIIYLAKSLADQVKVKEGDTVKRGEIIGLSGGSGRATGPHLHVAVRWQGTYLDPSRLLELKLP